MGIMFTLGNYVYHSQLVES